jgi:hypothetical protein
VLLPLEVPPAVDVSLPGDDDGDDESKI